MSASTPKATEVRAALQLVANGHSFVGEFLKTRGHVRFTDAPLVAVKFETTS
jgi:hypothetical protein